MSVKVNPEIFVWARKTAGLSLEQAARKLGLTASTKSTAEEKLEMLECGEKLPTQRQLSKMETVYRRPLLTFYMAHVPRTGRPRGQDFRQFPDECSFRDNAILDALFRDVRARQEMVRDILEDDEDFQPLSFVNSGAVDQGIEHAADSLADILDFDHTAPRRCDAAALFKTLREAAETAGVFVLIIGDLGSHHTAFPASAFRGFAIADDLAPFIVINAKDARPARSFTLIHELAHIWLGQTGICGDVLVGGPEYANARIERFCNDVAGEFLLPESQFQQDEEQYKEAGVGAAGRIVAEIAARRSVSESLVAWRLHQAGNMPGAVFDKLMSERRDRWQSKAVIERSGQVTGPESHASRQFSLGQALIGLVHRAVRDNALSCTKAAKVLGCKPGRVEPILRQFEAKRRSCHSSDSAA